MVSKAKKVAIITLSSVSLISIAVLLYVGYLFGVISFADKSALVGKDFPNDFEIAVVQTSQQKPKTYIEYYDKDLMLLAALEYPYRTCESPWGTPVTYDGKAYMTPQSKGVIGIDSFVAELDMKTGKVEEISADGGVTNVAVNDRYIFAAASGGIGRIDKTTQEVLSVDQAGRNFPFVYEDKLYVFNDMRVPTIDEASYLMIWDCNSMELLEDNLFPHGLEAVQPTGFIGNRLYFTSAYADGGNPYEESDWYLSYYSTEDKEMHNLTTIKALRPEFVAKIDSYLYLLCGGSPCKILTIDEQTGVIVGETNLSYSPTYIHVMKDTLYVTCFDMEYGTESLRAYKPDGTKLKEIALVDMQNHDSRGAAVYVSGLISNN